MPRHIDEAVAQPWRKPTDFLESWSEWQDLNLRPLVHKNAGGLPHLLAQSGRHVRWGYRPTTKARTPRTSSDNSEKLRNTVDKFEQLLLRFIAFRSLCCQPLAAGPKQSFNCLADWGVGIKVSRNQANSSAISIRSRLVKAANSIAQTIEQGA
jgi:hypothetical protein